MSPEPRCYRFGKGLTIDGKRASCGQLVTVGAVHDQAAGRPHLPVQKADCVLFVVVRTERIRTHHFGKIAGLVGECPDLRSHLMNDHGHAGLSGLPGGL